jgi:hypothetical protein
MQYVGAFSLLHCGDSVELPLIIEDRIDSTYSRLTIRKDGHGMYFWGKDLNHGHTVQVYMPSPDLLVSFSAALMNSINLSKFIKRSLDIECEALSLPLRFDKVLEDDQVFNYKLDSVVGPSFVLCDNTNGKFIVKFMTNGIVQFSMTDDDDVIYKIIDLYRKVMNI